MTMMTMMMTIMMMVMNIGVTKPILTTTTMALMTTMTMMMIFMMMVMITGVTEIDFLTILGGNV